MKGKNEKIATHLEGLAAVLEKRGHCPYCRGWIMAALQTTANAVRGDGFSLRHLAIEVPAHDCESLR